MTKRFKTKLLISVIAMFAAVALMRPAIGQVKQGKTRPMKTKQLMAGLVKPNTSGLGKGLKEQPADDKSWSALATHAALLNEASYILMDDGRCPDADWADAAKILREHSGAALEAIEAQDATAAAASFKAMTKACAACHKAHKK